MTDRLKGKVAIISGGATGMGGAASKLFAAEGARVAIIDRNGEAAAETVKQIRNTGGEADYWTADVSDEAAVNAAAAITRFMCPPRERGRTLASHLVATGREDGGRLLAT